MADHVTTLLDTGSNADGNMRLGCAGRISSSHAQFDIQRRDFSSARPGLVGNCFGNWKTRWDHSHSFRLQSRHLVTSLLRRIEAAAMAAAEAVDVSCSVGEEEQEDSSRS